MAKAKLLDPMALDRLSRLELVARHSVEGFLSGLHPSPYHGSSVEYADHRPYTIGDEIRSLDWKLLAKTDKLYIKLFEAQTNLRCNLLVDASKSMAFAHEHGSKFEYACRMACALAYLLLKQNDAVGLTLFDQKLRHHLPARATASHLHLISELMEQAQPAGESRIGEVLHEIASRIGKRSLVIVLSDLLDDPASIADGLAHFRFDRHEVIVFHIMDPAELDLPYERTMRFADLEGQGTIVANAATIKPRYQQRLGEFIHALRSACLGRDVAYQLCNMAKPYDQVLSSFLERRGRQRR